MSKTYKYIPFIGLILWLILAPIEYLLSKK